MGHDELTLTTDVLVIGGGLGATWAAAAAARTGAEVVVADKGWCGTSGITAQAGPGHWLVPPDPEARRDAVERQLEKSRGLGDPEWMERAMELTWETLPTLAGYYDFSTDTPGQPSYRGIRGPEYLLAMRRLITDLGVRILDHSPALELLRHDDGTVAGARGVRPKADLDWTVRAGAVVLATGGCAYRSRMLGADCNTGDGLLMGAEAGAELSGMEFSAIFSPAPAWSNMTRSTAFGFGTFTDEAGNQLDVSILDTRAMAKVARQGTVYCCFDRMAPHTRERFHLVQPAFLLPFRRRGIDPFTERFPIVLRGEGTIRGAGGLRLADLEAQTAVPGLYAAGDVASREPVAGAVSGGGAQSSAWALSSGQTAGRAAAERTRTHGRRADEPVTPLGGAGFGRAAVGTREPIAPKEVIDAVQSELLDTDKELFRTDAKLGASLARLDPIWPAVDEAPAAADRRKRVRDREAAAMLAAARWSLRSARARTESRGLHRREDYPEESPEWTHSLVVSGLDAPAVRPAGPPERSAVH